MTAKQRKRPLVKPAISKKKALEFAEGSTAATGDTERPGQGKGKKAASSASQGLVERPGGTSGKVPQGDVRLTANIRQDLHLRLKIAAAEQRTTIGELLEEMIEERLSGS